MTAPLIIAGLLIVTFIGLWWDHDSQLSLQHRRLLEFQELLYFHGLDTSLADPDELLRVTYGRGYFGEARPTAIEMALDYAEEDIRAGRFDRYKRKLPPQSNPGLSLEEKQLLYNWTKKMAGMAGALNATVKKRVSPIIKTK